VSAPEAIRLAREMVERLKSGGAMTRDLAAPAWVDSVHHALLTRLIGEQGAFPVSYAPYVQANTSSYHPGFHTLLAFFGWLSGAAQTLPDPAQDTRPVHMRTAQPAQRTRAPVTIRLEVDGHVEEHVFRAKGFKSDGLSVGELRVPLAAGPHSVAVRIATSADPAATLATLGAAARGDVRASGASGAAGT
jgi:hypothetical protein